VNSERKAVAARNQLDLPQPLEIEACYRYCEAVARARHHNFPVASPFAASRLRPHIFAIYAFARSADDFADEPEYDGRRASELDRWEERLLACFHGEPPDHPVFVALADTIERFDLPVTPFLSLLSGQRIDLETRRYATYPELRSYTAQAADPLAHLYLYLCGVRDADAHRYVADMASGLALANFWQQLRDDLARGRNYVPIEDALHFGLSNASLQARLRSPELAALIRFQVARTRSLFQRARPLIEQVGDDIAVELALMWHGGMRILDRIETIGDRVIVAPPRLTPYDKALVVARALEWRGGSLLRRVRRRVLEESKFRTDQGL
jgi:squalene synthase HpnC